MKKFLTILLTTVLFLAATVLTVSSVYRVGAVTLELTAVSEAAKEEASLLENTLSELYKTKSIFFVEDEQAKEAISAYPHFRLTGFEKAYPNRLIFYCAEDAEVYAVQKEDGYYVLGADGTVLTERSTPYNRSDGKANVVLRGFSFQAMLGSVPSDETFRFVLAFARTLDVSFGGIRSNVKEISITNTEYRPDDVVLKMTMREGLVVTVYNPANSPEKKAENCYAFYSEMKTAERMSGELFVSDDGVCNYEP